SPSCSCNPGCTITGNGTVFIQHGITSTCDPFKAKGTRKIVISDGGKLAVTGNVEVRDNSQLDIANGDTCLINGDLLVHGNGSRDVEGYLQAAGDVTTSAIGSVCGTGMTGVWGSISGSGWCMGLSVLPVEMLFF